MEIIVPAAGLSTRFPNSKPKYLLHDFTGKSMLYRAVEPFLAKNNITIGILKEHNIKYGVVDTIAKEFGNLVNVVVLPNLTSGPAETVFQIINDSNIDLQKSLFVKDCDSFFMHNVLLGNYVCVSRIENHNTINKIHNKSFVIENNQGIVTKIIEKQVVSNTFCIGGYKFNSCSDYKIAFESIRCKNKAEIFVSHVIQQMMLSGHTFQTNDVTDYVDVGTIEDWVMYNTPKNFEF